MGRRATADRSPGATAFRSPAIRVRPRAGRRVGDLEHAIDLRQAPSLAPARQARAQMDADDPDAGVGQLDLDEVARPRHPVPAGLRRGDAAQHRHGSTGRVDDDPGAGRVRDVAHDPRVGGLLEHGHVGIEALDHVREEPAAPAPPLADVVGRDSDLHMSPLRTTYGCPWTSVRRSRNQPAIAWMLTGRRAIAWARRRARSSAGATQPASSDSGSVLIPPSSWASGTHRPTDRLAHDDDVEVAGAGPAGRRTARPSCTSAPRPCCREGRSWCRAAARLAAC